MKKKFCIIALNGDAIMCESKHKLTSNGCYCPKVIILSPKTGQSLQVKRFFIKEDKILYTFFGHVD